MNIKNSPLILVFGMWLFFVLACSQGGTSTSSSSAPASAERQVTAEALFKSYQSNEVAADNSFKGRIIDVTGKVDHIAKGLISGGRVLLDSGTGSVMFYVQCEFEDDQVQSLASLQNGQTATFRCKGNGKIGSVMMEDCRVVATTPTSAAPPQRKAGKK
jgi:hypothetical protein